MACRILTNVTTCPLRSAFLKTILQSTCVGTTHGQVCQFSNTQPNAEEKTSKYKMVIVGAGAGGCSVAAKFASLGKDVAVVEPSDMHYYQPIWTLVGAGLKDFNSSGKPMQEVMPSSCQWIKDKAVNFDPDNNFVKLASGEKLEYDYLVVAMGLQLDFDKVKGLEEALAEDPMVVSNYSPKFVTKTYPALKQFSGGKAIFTFPNTPIKCAGAPQKIMYLADELFRKNNVRDKTEIIYNTSLGVIFGVKKYADALLEVVANRDIKVNFKHSLVEVDHKSRVAMFEQLDSDGKLVPFKYDFMHVSPPMSSPGVIRSSPLANAAGFVDVHKSTLQHLKYKNVFSLGDCSSLPTAKTAAAVAAQCGIVHTNLSSVMEGNSCDPMYDGYTSCPLVTSSKSCILAEFDYDAQPLETFPFNQGKERWTTYNMKSHIMPRIYWDAMLKGNWNGPKTFRKILHLGMGRTPNIPEA